MIRRISAIILLLCSVATMKVTAQQQPATYFPYPIVPDSISTLQGRTDYLIDHFWDFCDMKKAFSHRNKMAEAFKDYLSFMPHASARQVHRSVAKLIKSLEKQPDDLLFLAQKAEEYVHSDTAEVYSDELYIPFAIGVASNKHIDKAIREAYHHQATLLTNSQVGAPAPEFEFTDRNGNRQKFENDTAYQVTVIFFNDPDCMDCRIARSRLNANLQASKFIEAGVMRIVAITPGDPDEQWKEMAASYPEEWTVGAAPDIDEVYEITSTPEFYVIGPDGKIAIKRLNIDGLLTLISRF